MPLRTLQRTLQSVPLWLALLLATPLPLPAQLGQIDRAKLPQTAAVQQSFTDLLPIEAYARNYSQTWPYPVPKEQATLRFTTDLRTLQQAQKAAPDNAELRLLTGLVAHLGYNLEVESAYEPAMQLLQASVDSTPADPRPRWFLAMQQCESNDPVAE